MTAHPAPPGLDACTRCGFCLQACPTYRILSDEGDSPRGRVQMIDAIARGAEPTSAMAQHLYTCLGCRACESACPSGVPFGQLLEYGRHEIEHSRAAGPGRGGWRVFRAIAFKWILPSRALFAAFMAPARLLQRSARLCSWLSRLPLPAQLRKLIAMLPPAGSGRAATQNGSGAQIARVGILTGCVMDALFSDVHASLADLLRRRGCTPIVPEDQWCCGALNVHAGERDGARAMARRNIDAFERAEVDVVIVDSAGCGAHMKAYGELLTDDPAYAPRAAAFAAKVRDAAEYLAALDPVPMRIRPRRRVTYQDACHLAHGQRIRQAPRSLIRAIDGVELVEMRDADRCCGAAGVYSLTHPAMSAAVLDEKMRRIAETSADTVVVTNPGCHMQLLAGVAERGGGVRVCHLVELLREASVD